MYRSLMSTVALVLGLAACHPHGPPAGEAPAVDHHPIAAGESNRFFVANSAHTLAISTDVRATRVRDLAGHKKGLRLAARDNSVVTVTCECPASCSSGEHRPLSFGCWTTGASDAHCWGSCGGPDPACASCGMIYWHGPAAGTVEEPDGVAIAEGRGR